MRFPLLFRAVTCLTSGALVATSCTQAVDLVPAASITLQPPLDSIELSETYSRWIVSVKDAAGNTLTGRSLSWNSESPAIASVDAATGTVTGLAIGEALINVSLEGKTAQSRMKVLHPVQSIVVSPDSFDLPLTTTRTINAAVVGLNGVALTNRSIIWSSSNTAIAVVSASGVVTAIGLGTATITLKAGLKDKAVRVRVVGEPIASVRITPNQSVHVVRLGQTYQLSAQCLNANLQVLTGRPIVWNSSNPLVASVSSTGTLTGQGVGSANVTATCDNSVSATVTAQVTLVPVSSVTITPNGVSLAFGALSQLTATARDSANNVLSLQGRNVIWSSSNIPVATVSTLGVVQASGSNAGTSQITVSVDNVTSAPITVDVHAFMLAFSRARVLTLGEWLKSDE